MKNAYKIELSYNKLKNFIEKHSKLESESYDFFVEESNTALNEDKINEFTSLITRILEGSEIKGEELEEKWFPIDKEYDVFISHSHKDVKVLKAYLESKGIKCFLDYDIWEYSEKIINQIIMARHRFSMLSDKVLDDILKVTNEVNMLLATSLLKVIDKTNCFLLVSTENLEVDTDDGYRTNSPWIYFENVVREAFTNKVVVPYNENMNMLYAINVSHRTNSENLKPIELEDLDKLCKLCKNSKSNVTALFSESGQVYPLVEIESCKECIQYRIKVLNEMFNSTYFDLINCKKYEDYSCNNIHMCMECEIEENNCICRNCSLKDEEFKPKNR